MSKVSKITKPVEIDITEYVNITTGETLPSAVQGSSLSIKKDTGMKVISSTNYSVIETESLNILMRVLNNSDLASVIKMSIITRTPLNLVYNENIPHTNETLQKYLEVGSESMFMKLIRRLIKAGVLYQIKGRIYGEVRVCYMLNPYLSRRRKTFEDKVFQVFEKFDAENYKGDYCIGC